MPTTCSPHPQSTSSTSRESDSLWSASTRTNNSPSTKPMSTYLWISSSSQLNRSTLVLFPMKTCLVLGKPPIGALSPRSTTNSPRTVSTSPPKPISYTTTLFTTGARNSLQLITSKSLPMEPLSSRNSINNSTHLTYHSHSVIIPWLLPPILVPCSSISQCSPSFTSHPDRWI